MGDDKSAADKEYEVQPGDRMSSIAHAKGKKNYLALYKAQSADFQKKRPNPEILMPGDKVSLPDKVEDKLSAKEKKNTKFTQDSPPPELRVHLHAAGKPLAGKSLDVLIESAPYSKKSPFKGTVKTDDKGVAKFFIEHEVTEVVLSCKDPKLTCKLLVGYLHPVTEAGGVEQRLDNLGYRVPIAAAAAPPGSDAEKEAKKAQDRLRSKAVARFHEDHGKGAKGTVDDDARALLTKIHEP